jgi:hypothetical protein
MRTRILTSLGRSALYGVFAAWGAVSITRQFTHEGPIPLQKTDPYGLFIPNYHFFCPEPARHDQNLLYRDKFPDGDTGPWQELVTTERRRLSHMLLYPHRRLDKGMMDLAGEVTRFAKIVGDVRQLSLTRPYMSMLNLVTYGVSHDPRAVQTQFAVAHSAAYEPAVEPTVSFVSNFHDLPSQASSAPRHRDAVTA